MDGIQIPGAAAGGQAVQPLKALEQVKGKKTNDPKEVKKAAEAFEAYFISSLLKEMRKTVPHQGILESGPGKEIYEALLDQTLATKMSERGGIGLAKLIVKKLADQPQVLKEPTDK